MEAKINKNWTFHKKCTKERIDAILKDISEFSTNKHAAESNGVSEGCFYYWIEQGILDLMLQKDTLHAYLAESLRKIEQADIKECSVLIRSNKQGHKGAQWHLEHKYWRQFSPAVADIEFHERLIRLEEDTLHKEKSNDKKEQMENRGIGNKEKRKSRIEKMGNALRMNAPVNATMVNSKKTLSGLRK